MTRNPRIFAPFAEIVDDCIRRDREGRPTSEALATHLESTLKVHHPPHGEEDIFIRPIRSSDERRLQDFFYSHSEETIHMRYGYAAQTMSHERARSLGVAAIHVSLTHAEPLALASVVVEADDA